MLVPRLLLFSGITIIVILVFTIKYGVKKQWVKNSIITIISIAVIAMAFGEFMSVKFHNRNKEVVYNDLMILKEQQSFTSRDLIITKNGAEHISNWFLNVKAAMITSLNTGDFKKYDNIYVLNPIEGELNFQGIRRKKAHNEADKYHFMLRNIPRPEGVEPIYKSEYIEFFRLESAPEEWEFNAEGRWSSYSAYN